MKKDYYYFLFCLISVFMSVEGCSKNEDDDLAAAPDIALNKSSLILEKGKGERLIASFTPADTPNQGHTWSSSAPDIATVDETGMVSGVGLGESTITVTALDGRKTAKCQVTVTDKIINVTGVSLSETEEILVAGDNLQLEAIIVPSTATDKTVTWESSDNKVASVDGKGVVTAITEGNTTITATTNDGDKTASCKITVRGKGVDISKPEVSDVTSISAFVTGDIEVFGVKVTERGICYSTSQSPTIENQKVPLSSDEIAHTLTGMEPSTTYYVRIYAIVDGTAKYGDQETFTTKVSVEISEPKVSSITTNTAYIEGTIKTFGLQTDETGICYSTSQMPTINDTKVVLSNNNIEYTLNELTTETTYYVRIYAKVKGEVYYGEQGVFATTGVIKTHFEPTDIYVDKIILVSPGIKGITSLKICYGTSPDPRITDNITTATTSSDGKLHLTLTNLKQGTSYYIRAYNLNGSKVNYYDDEVSAQTIGRDVKYSRKYKRYEAYDWYDSQNIKYTRYRFFYTYTYTIQPVGTYHVTTNNYVTISKTTDYSTSIYLSNGTGSFEIKQEFGMWWEYEGSSKYMKFLTEGEIVFTNMENSLRYHLVVPSKSYVN